jgi:hypothetical protein
MEFFLETKILQIGFQKKKTLEYKFNIKITVPSMLYYEPLSYLKYILNIQRNIRKLINGDCDNLRYLQYVKFLNINDFINLYPDSNCYFNLSQSNTKQQLTDEEKLDKKMLKRLEEEEKRKSKLDKERLDKERLDKERLDKERLDKERLDKERLDKERLDKERRKAKLEEDRLDKERLDKERLDKERRKAKLEEDRLKILEEEEIKNKCKTKKLEAEEEKKHKLQQNDVLYTYNASYHPRGSGRLNFLGTPWKNGKITLNSNNIIFNPEDNSKSITFDYVNPVNEETGMEKFKDCTDRESIEQAKCLIFTKEKGIKPIIRFNNREELEDFKNNRKKIIDRK